MELVTTKICLVKNIGNNGNLFGGDMLSFLDEAGAAFCSEYCGTQAMVTKKISEVIFENPVKEGELIKIYAKMVKIGNTSATVKLEARVQSVFTGNQEVVCQTEIIFVRIDPKGKSRPIDEAVKIKFNSNL